MPTIEGAKQLAIQYHGAQVDKAGAPYIGHLQRVADGVKDSDAKIVAFLHDILEDTECTPKVLLDHGYSQHIVDAVIALTKRPEEHGTDKGYAAFIARAAKNPIARQVKISDLTDNRDLSRLPNVTNEDIDRAEKYDKSIRFLQNSFA